MTVDVPGLCAGLPTTALTATVLRHCYIPAAGHPDPLRVSAAMRSRWQTAGGTLYLADGDVTVWAEYCRHCASDVAAADPTGGVGLRDVNFSLYGPRALREPVSARALFEVTVSMDRVADLTGFGARQLLADEGVDVLADDYGVCPAIASQVAANGWQALRVPSAAYPGGVCVAVLPGCFPARKSCRMVMDFARPKVATAYLTRYRLGERPGWL